MKASVSKTLLILLSGLCAAHLPAAPVDLFAEPSEAGGPIATVEESDPAFRGGSVVLDTEKAAEGWLWGEYETTFTGYVSDAKINKQLLPVEGALIHLRPGAESPVLTTVAPGDRVEIIDTGEWWTVRFRKSIPVYYRSSGPLPLGVEVEGTAPDDVPAAPRTSATAGPVAAPLTPAQPLQEGGPAELGSDGARRSMIPEKTPPPARDLAREFEGEFRRARKTAFFLEPPFPFELVHRSGDRIAYVDVEHVVITGSIDKFLGERVIISGTFEPISAGPEIVVHARNLRIKK